MFRISRDTPALYNTSVATNRLPVFRKNALKDLACEALTEARRSVGSSTPKRAAGKPRFSEALARGPR